jgi:transposase-like protein
MATTKRRARRGRAQWQRLVEQAARSPRSVAAFCRAEDVSTASFYSWRKRLGAPMPGANLAEPPAEDGTFLELGMLSNEAAGPAPWDIELELGAGMVLRLRRR